MMSTTLYLVALALLPQLILARLNAFGKTDSKDWDQLILAQRWAPSVCAGVTGNSGKAEPCKIPSGVSETDFIMHGLWPTKNHTEGPVNCDSNHPFRPKLIYPLLSQLLKYWPDLESAGNPNSTDFWKHEWEKHGTCAENFPPLSGELNYFSQSLKLRQKYDIYDALARDNVLPSDTRPYKYDQIAGSLQSTFGRRVELHCTHSKVKQQYYLAEIRLCLAKDFSDLGCAEKTAKRGVQIEVSECPKTGAGLLYPTFSNTVKKGRKFAKKYQKLNA